MKKSDALVVIVGESTKNLYKFVRWEIENAIDLGLPIIVANLNNKTRMDSGRCPAILRDVCAVHIPFKKDAIKHALANWPGEWRRLSAQDKAGGPRYYDKSWE